MAWTSVEAMEALQSTDLLRVGMEADRQRRALHPENVVTYALAAPAGLSLEEAVQQAQCQSDGSVMLDRIAGIAAWPPDQLASRIISLRGMAPALQFHLMPALSLSGSVSSSLLPRLRDAGLRSLLLDTANHQAFTASAQQVEPLLQAAAALSLGVTVAYTIGRGEPVKQRMEELQQMRLWQQSTQAIQAVALRIHHAAADLRREEEATAVDYLKTLAVTRLYLDGIAHLSAEWDVLGPKVLELALRFGADDAGSVPSSQAARQGPSHHGGESELRRIIRDAGFRPVERDAVFRQSLLR